jgi:hypothetical protein
VSQKTLQEMAGLIMTTSTGTRLMLYDMNGNARPAILTVARASSGATMKMCRREDGGILIVVDDNTFRDAVTQELLHCTLPKKH